jgi:hypothetical protein
MKTMPRHLPRPVRGNVPRIVLRIILLAALAMTALAVSAQPRAWLDRDRIAMGETVTLNIETTALTASPDYTPLEQDFTLSGHTSSRDLTLGGGQNGTRTLFAVALKPRRDGVLTVPAIEIGGERTSPLPLVVTPAVQRPTARAGDDIFIESLPDDDDPYVQQSVGWVVRLYSAVPLISGTLDQPAPRDASFQRVGDDAQYSREVGGRRYQVIERRYLLVPERSGTLTVPGATFEGRGTAGLFDEFFGSGRGGALAAQVGPRTLQVRAIPGNAPQPWLPLHDLALRYRANPTVLQQGNAATLTIEATADGATAAQMPELNLPPIEGVQVFAEKPQIDETFNAGRPQVKLTRMFSLVPGKAGEAKLSGVRMDWWDVKAGQARSATLPSLSWTVEAGTGQSTRPLPAMEPSSAPIATGDAGTRPGAPADALATAHAGSDRGWIIATAAFAVLWLLTLILALHWRATSPTATAGTQATGATQSRGAPKRAALRQALDTGSFDEVAVVLCGMAQPPATDVDQLRERLDDPAQREALDALQRARWADGDGPGARQQLRAAFADGPRWRDVGNHDTGPLPPLYPPG